MPSRRDLPVARFKLANGLCTKVSPEATAGEFLLAADNVDSFDVYLGVSKIHGSSRLSDQAPGTYRSLNYAEAFDLDGDLQRKLYGVVATGTAATYGNLYDINLTTGALTLVTADLTAEHLSQVVVNNRVHFCSPGNQPFKVDMGNQYSDWGVVAPGAETTILETFGSTSNWTVTSGTIAASTLTPPELFDSNGSTQVNKTLTTTSGVYVTRNSVGWNLSNAGEDTFFLWFRLPSGGLTKVPTAGPAVQLTLSSGTTYGETHASRYNWYIDDLREGWNLLTAVTTSPSQTFGTGANLSNVGSARVAVYTKNDSTTLTGTNFDQLGYYNSGTASVSANNGTSGPIEESVLSYRFSFVDKYGYESNAGPASDSVTVTTGTVTLTSIPVSDNPYNTGVNIYRDLDGDQTYLYVTTVYNGTTSLTDTTPYDSLSSVTPAYAGDPVKDFSPPPRLRSAGMWNRRVVGINEAFPDTLEISRADNEQAFPIINQRTFDSELVSVVPTFLGLMIFATDCTYLLSGSDPLDAPANILHSEVGTVGRRSAVPIKSYAVTLHDDGPYLAHQTNTFWYVGDNIRDFWETQDAESLSDAFVVHDRRKFRLLFFTKSDGSSTFDKISVWSYGKKGSVLQDAERSLEALDMRRASWFTMTPPVGINPTCAVVGEKVADLPVVWVGCDNGLVYEFQDEDTHNWVTSSGYGSGSVTTPLSDSGFIDSNHPDNTSWTGKTLRFTSGPYTSHRAKIYFAGAGIVGFTPAAPAISTVGTTFELIDVDVSTPVVARIKTTDLPIGEATMGRGRPRFVELNGRFNEDTQFETTLINRKYVGGPVVTSGTFYITASGLSDSRLVPVPGYLWGYTTQMEVVSSGTNDHPILFSIGTHYLTKTTLGGPK